MPSHELHTVEDLQRAARQTALPLGLATLFGLIAHIVAVFAMRSEKPLAAAVSVAIICLLHVNPPRFLYFLALKANGAVGTALVAGGLVFSVATSRHPQVLAFALCATASTVYGEWAARRLAGCSLPNLVRLVNRSSMTR